MEPKRKKREIEIDFRPASESDFSDNEFERSDVKSDTSYGASNAIPSNMSKWNEQDLNEIGIAYAGNGFASPHDVLDAGQNITICKLAKLREEVKDIINYLDTSLTFEVESDWSGNIVGLREIDNNLKLDYQNLQSNLERELNKNSSRLQLMDTYVYARSLVQRLKDLLCFQLNKEYVYEAFYTELLKTFGSMCGLRAEDGGALKRRVNIGGRAVTSIPDIRFRLQTLSQVAHWTEALVSIAEVKKSAPKARESNKMHTKQSKKSTPSTSTTQLSSFDIHHSLDSAILGQHGGELLAEWKHVITDQCVIGMILCASKVIVTSLKLEVKEIEEIYENGKLKGSKTVLINYSVPLDIFQKADRKILYEVLFRLSETVGCVSYITGASI